MNYRKKSDPESRIYRICIRLNKTEKDQLEFISKYKNLSKSSVITQILGREYGNCIKECLKKGIDPDKIG